MPAAPVPTNEQQRLKALELSGVTRTSQHSGLVEIAKEAAQLAHTPIAAVTFISDHHQWVKATFGNCEENDDRNTAFCSWAIHSQEVLWVEDAQADARFSDNPLVEADPGIRHYAGAPIATPDGYLLGTVCVIDHVPRTHDPALTASLQDLASRVSDILFQRPKRAT